MGQRENLRGLRKILGIVVRINTNGGEDENENEDEKRGDLKISTSHERRSKRLNHYQFCELFADGEAGVADLANEVISAGEQFYDLVLTQAEFAEAVLKFGSSAKLFDANGNPGFHQA